MHAVRLYSGHVRSLGHHVTIKGGPVKRRAVVMLGLVVGTGCSVHLDPKVPGGLGTPRAGSVGIGAEARGMPSRVGWGTFTVFAIPIAPVHISNGPGERIIMEKLKETLAGAGYEPVEGSVPGDRPVLECDIKRFSFRNYTWLAPLVFTWGGIDLDLRLVGQGSPLWQRSYTGKDDNSFSFSDAANRSMEQILEQFGRDVASDEFFRACCQQPVAATPDALTPNALGEQQHLSREREE